MRPLTAITMIGSIVMVSSIPKEKRFVLESDEEDQSDIVSAPDAVSIDKDRRQG